MEKSLIVVYTFFSFEYIEDYYQVERFEWSNAFTINLSHKETVFKDTFSRIQKELLCRQDFIQGIATIVTKGTFAFINDRRYGIMQIGVYGDVETDRLHAIRQELKDCFKDQNILRVV